MNAKDPLLEKILSELLEDFSDNIISIYGIGSYFDDRLPPDWMKNDVDLIIIVKDLEKIPKQEWTDVRYERKKFDDYEAWYWFLTREALQNKELFEKQTFSNYKWSLLDIKHTENSVLLHGEDIRPELPELENIPFDYDDLFVRSPYMLFLRLIF